MGGLRSTDVSTAEGDCQPVHCLIDLPDDAMYSATGNWWPHESSSPHDRNRCLEVDSLDTPTLSGEPTTFLWGSAIEDLIASGANFALDFGLVRSCII